MRTHRKDHDDEHAHALVVAQKREDAHEDDQANQTEEVARRAAKQVHAAHDAHDHTDGRQYDLDQVELIPRISQVETKALAAHLRDLGELSQGASKRPHPPDDLLRIIRAEVIFAVLEIDDVNEHVRRVEHEQQLREHVRDELHLRNQEEEQEAARAHVTPRTAEEPAGLLRALLDRTHEVLEGAFVSNED